jgi:hypothetical protein
MHIVNKLYRGSSQGLPFFMMPNLLRHSKFLLFSIKIYVDFLTLRILRKLYLNTQGRKFNEYSSVINKLCSLPVPAAELIN